MKHLWKSKFFILISIVIVALISGCTIYRVYVYPRLILQTKMSELHRTIVNRDVKKLLSLCTDDFSRIIKIAVSEQNDGDWFETYEKFESHYRIEELYYGPMKSGDETYMVISTRIKKVNKEDGKSRDSFRVNLKKSEGEWLFDAYYFPDYVDY